MKVMKILINAHYSVRREIQCINFSRLGLLIRTLYQHYHLISKEGNNKTLYSLVSSEVSLKVSKLYSLVQCYWTNLWIDDRTYSHRFLWNDFICLFKRLSKIFWVIRVFFSQANRFNNIEICEFFSTFFM